MSMANSVVHSHNQSWSGFRVTLPRVIRSEWIKVWSVRSTVATFGVAFLVVVFIGALASLLGDRGPDDGEMGAYDPVWTSLFGVLVGQVVVGVLGAVIVTTEYATGSIRATLTAVPKRLPVLWAKVIAMTGITFVTMLAASFLAFLLGQALYRGGGESASLGDPGVLRAIIGAAIAPTAIAVMGIALGVLMRHTAIAVAALFGLLFVVPLFLEILGLGGIWADIASYLPSNAGEAMFSVVMEEGQLSPLAGVGVMAAWVAALLAGAAVALKHRDA